MIIYDFNVMGVSFLPAEADAPLVINTNTPLPVAVAGELFKTIAGRHPQKVESGCCMELFQFALGRPLGILGQSGGESAVE